MNVNLNVLRRLRGSQPLSVAAPAPAAGDATAPARRGARPPTSRFDRLTPVALLQLGFRLRFFKEQLQFSAQFYNVLNQHYYYPDSSTT